MAGRAELEGALESLRTQLAALRLPLVARDAAESRATAARASAQIADYVLPRLRSLEAPLLTVVGGSTGSGKSTVVNSLVGRTVTRPGVLRPTTRHPVLVHHPDDLAWFADDRVLPGLPRITGADPAAGPPGAEDVLGLQLVADDRVPAGLALLDAPDIDSVARANRELAAMLMAAADLWLFLTTAARYSDAVPWAALRGAAARDAAVALVLNRVPAEAVGQVTSHLRSLLAAEALADAPLFVIAEAPLHDGLLAHQAVGPIRRWLDELGGDADARAAVARRTLDGAIANLAVEVLPVADAMDRQVLAAARLREAASKPFAQAAARLDELSEDGSMLRGEVLARWQEFVGASELFRTLETGMARLRDRVTRALRGEPVAPTAVAEALESGLARVLLDELAGAYEQADAAWRDDPAGLELLDGADLSPVPERARGEAESLVRAWQADVLELVRSEGADRRTSARALAYSVNGAGLALMVLVFGATGGITGAEVGIAGGTAVLAQKLLEAVFSEDAVRRMATTARERLHDRVAGFTSDHARTFTDRLEALGIDPAASHDLRVAVAHLLGAREPAAGGGLPAVRVGAVPVAPARRRWREWLRGGA
ncbi:MAG TPA: GTPase domain-containing protein [Candidatus Nanopelagicales bacterium]